MERKTLLPHQDHDASFLASRHFAGCFSGMGTGKTITALEAFKRSDARRLLVIAPPIALQMWADEAAAWLGAGGGAWDIKVLTTGKVKIGHHDNVLICSYQIATSRALELSAWLGDEPSAMICDESHALKSTKAKRTKAILGHGGICRSALYSWMLTGTPITRHNDDLIPFLFRAAPERMKSVLGGLTIEKFKLRYCIQQKRQFAGARWPVEMVIGSRNTAELRDLLYAGDEAVAVRRELREVWDAMPPISFNTYTIKLHMDADLRAKIRELDKRPISDLQLAMQRAEPALATVRRQIGEAKVAAAADVLRERVEDGAGPVLVGVWHRTVGGPLSEALRGVPGMRVGLLDGSTSQAKKRELELAFNAGELDVLVGQIASMGVSLNLQKGGNSIVVVEEDWSPEVMAQFYARLHRMGQRKAVHVDVLSGGTKLETAVSKIARRKAANAAFLNDVEAVDD